MFISKKGLRSSWPKFMPNLVRHYQYLSYDLLSNTPTVKKKDWDRFLKFEQGLLAAQINPEEYTKVILLYWKQFMRKQKWINLPINIFLGDKSINVFAEYLEQSTVSIVKKDGDMDVAGVNWQIVVQVEYEVCNFCIAVLAEGLFNTEEEYIDFVINERPADGHKQQWIKAVKMGLRTKMRAEAIERHKQQNRWLKDKDITNYYQLAIAVLEHDIAEREKQSRFKVKEHYTEDDIQW